MIDHGALIEMREFALSVREPIADSGRLSVMREGVVVEAVGRTGARVCKFVMGEAEEAVLAVLTEQRARKVAATIHRVVSYREHPKSSDPRRFKFDAGESMTPEVAEDIMTVLRVESATVAEQSQVPFPTV